MLATSNSVSTWSLNDSIKMKETQSRSVLRIEHPHKIPSGSVGCNPKLVHRINVLEKYTPSFETKPVQIKVEYARPTFSSTRSATTGSKPAFDKLKGQLCAEYGSKVQISGGPGRTMSFEVYANGELIHSKLGGSSGKVDTTGTPIWTEKECKALSAKLKPLVKE